MAGRKPLLVGHVDGLDGSQRAKQRLCVFLGTLGGILRRRTASTFRRAGVNRFRPRRFFPALILPK